MKSNNDPDLEGQDGKMGEMGETVKAINLRPLIITDIHDYHPEAS
jgi:hypothetical protein